MQQLSHNELKMLMQRQTGSHVSLYMSTYQAGADVQQNAIRNGGTVYVVDPDAVPGGQHAAAVFRYEV